MPSEFYRRRIRQVLDLDLPKEETMAEIVAVMALGLDQLREEIHLVKHLIIQNERARRGLPHD